MVITRSMAMADAEAQEAAAVVRTAFESSSLETNLMSNLPKFSGDGKLTVKDFFASIFDYKKLANISDKRMCLLIPFLLRGSAREAFNLLERPIASKIGIQPNI